MEQFENYYSLLSISRNATTEEIRAAYRRKSREWHPDVNPGRDTTVIMQQLNRAKDILLNPLLRSQFDLELSNYESPNLRRSSSYGSNERNNERFQLLLKRAAEFQGADRFLYMSFERRIKSQTDQELLGICGNWTQYQKEFIDMVILELHLSRKFELNEIYSRIRKENDVRKEVSASWEFFKYFVWIIFYLLAHILKNN